MEPGKEILPNRLKLCACTSLTLDFFGILARTTVPVSIYDVAGMFVPTKTPVLALAVTHRKFAVTKIRMTDLPVLNPWSRIFSAPVTGLSTW
jgi:hypothetical protein